MAVRYTRAAARAAARAASEAAWYAARDAAWDAECSWQADSLERLLQQALDTEQNRQ